MTYTVEDIDEAIENEDTYWEGSWDEFHEVAGSSQEAVLDGLGRPVTETLTYRSGSRERSYQSTVFRDKGWKGTEIAGIGRATLVDEFGGEGQGDDYFIIFSVTEPNGNVRLFKRNGYHQSHDGSYLDGPTEEVRETQEVITVYKAV